MGSQRKAAARATLAVSVWALLMLFPPVYVLTLIPAMLPLWVLSNLGVGGLGNELHGFFVPSVTGWWLVATIAWILFFWFFHARLRKAPLNEVGKKP